MTQEPAAIIADADWLAYRYHRESDSVHFRHVPITQHRRTTFLTDEYLGVADRIVPVRRPVAMTLPRGEAPLHFIFHSAFCCSTLLARAFDIDGVALGLKEPVILNDLVGIRHRRELAGRDFAERLRHMLLLLARPRADGAALVIKPSNVANALAPAMMAMMPGARALLLHAPLDIYLKSIAKKGIDGRLWVRDLLAKLITDGLIDLGFDEADYLRLTDIQAAAVGWLAQHALFARMAAEYPNRIRTLDSETLLSKPTECLVALARLYGLNLSDKEIAAIIQGPAFASHSKTGARFGADERGAEYDEAAAAHADELHKVAYWAQAVADNAGVAITLPGHLLT